MRVAIQAAADKQLADAKQQVRPIHGVSSWATSTQTTWSYLVFCLASFFLSLAAQAAVTLIHSLVTSKVDYCNSLLYGVPNQLIQNLQTVSNSAARKLTYNNKLEHIKPLLEQLHWLPVQFRIQYKILLMTFKCLNDAAPAYLEDLIHPNTPNSSLRSDAKNYVAHEQYHLKRLWS